MDNNVQVYGQGLPKEDIYTAVLKFIDEAFSTFLFPRDSDENFIRTEDKITSAVVMHFDDIQERISGQFKFINQDPSKLDIGVVLGRGYNPHHTEPFFLIEAKRLPTPIDRGRDPNEYVHITPPSRGHGGIERFKSGRHAKNFSYVAMLGYIQDGQTSVHWWHCINSIIKKLSDDGIETWSERDKLHKSKMFPLRFCSTHIRNSGNHIKIWHFFENEK